MKAQLAVYLVQFAIALILAPLLPGIINRVKAKFAGRHGKPVLLYDVTSKGCQSYLELAREVATRLKGAA